MYDMAKVKKLKALGDLAPEAMAAYEAFDAAAMKDGALPAKTKELIALAVAFTTQCPYCIEIHARKARSHGCTDAEIAEAIFVSAALRAGGAMTHGAHALT